MVTGWGKCCFESTTTCGVRVRIVLLFNLTSAAPNCAQILRENFRYRLCLVGAFVGIGSIDVLVFGLFGRLCAFFVQNAVEVQG